MHRSRRLGRAFYRRDPREVAPELLGKVLVHGRRRARVVEVEAYCGAGDPASHAYRGRTRRNATMFGPPGHLYVYFVYGMHWCANVVCGPAGEAGAVLLRAVRPLEGQQEMRRSRPGAGTDRSLCDGPAKLCEAFAFDGSFDGVDLVRAERGVTVCDDGEVPGLAVVGPRVGLPPGHDEPWRWYVAGDPHVSRPR